jgi:hypothetical protein
VVRHDILGLTDQGTQLTDLPIAACELGEDSPADGVAGELEERRWRAELRGGDPQHHSQP